MVTTSRGTSRWLGILGVIAIGSMAITAPARAQEVPDKEHQEVLIKTTLLTFNDANVTGNYTVMHAKLSKTFRDQTTPARLKQAFKAFADNKIDFDVIAARLPVLSKEAKVNDKGVLMLEGYFDIPPHRVDFDLEYIIADREWKPLKIKVNVK